MSDQKEELVNDLRIDLSRTEKKSITVPRETLEILLEAYDSKTVFTPAFKQRLDAAVERCRKELS